MNTYVHGTHYYQRYTHIYMFLIIGDALTIDDSNFNWSHTYKKTSMHDINCEDIKVWRLLD